MSGTLFDPEAVLGPHARLLQEFMDTAPDAMILVGQDGRIMIANRQVENLFGYAPRELVGRLIEDLIPERFRGPHPDHRDRYFKDPKIRPMGAGLNLFGVRRDGTEFPVEISLAPMNQKGRPFVTAAIRDVTDRRRAEDAIRQSRAQLEEAQAIAHIGSWEWDLGTPNISWSPELYRIYGIQPVAGVLPLERFMSMVHPEDRDELHSLIDNAISSGQPFEVRHRIIRPDGEVRHLHGRGNIALDETGKPARMVGTAQDITDQRLAQERLEASLAEKEVLLKEIHHRVKNNLQIVASLLNLQTGHVVDPQAIAALQDSRNRVRSMALVHESIYQGERFRGIDFKAYIERLAGTLFRTYTDKGTGVRVTVDAEPVRLDLDAAVQCGLILNELLSNSLKHAFPQGGGTITVRLKPTPEGGCILEVADDGRGFDTDRIATHETLGLQLVERLVGQLRAAIERDGSNGCRTTITIPPTHRQEDDE